MSNKLQQDHVPLTPKEKDENIQWETDTSEEAVKKRR